MKTHLNRLFLLAVALVLLGLLLIPALAVVLYRSLVRMSPAKTLGYLSGIAFSIALAIDVMGNVIGRDLFCATLIKPAGYPFGKPYETISAVLGKNKANETLTDLGRGLANLLNWIDKGHVERAAGAYSNQPKLS